MKITFTGHAGLLIETNDVNILCDPWHSDNPAFFKTWSVYPDNKNLDWDKIYDEMTSGDYENLIEVFDRYFGSFVILER